VIKSYFILKNPEIHEKKERFRVDLRVIRQSHSTKIKCYKWRSNMQFGMMDSYGNGMGYGMGILGLIFWILVIIGLVLLIKYLWEGG
jgi:uncharacterized membrane protein